MSTETTTQTQATTTETTQAAPAPDWTTGLSDEDRGYIQNKGFKDTAAVLSSYRNMEKLMGVPQDYVVKIPQKADDVEAWNSVYNKLGRPEKADDYKLTEGWKDTSANWAKNTFHKLGLTRSQAENLAKEWDTFSAAEIKAQENEAVMKAQESENSLKKEWGSSYDHNSKLAKAAAAKFGLTEEVIDALELKTGYAGVMKFLAEVGKSVGEDTFVTGQAQTNPNRMSPEAARERIKALQNDGEFYSRLMAGSATEKSEWDRLHVLAYPADKVS